MELSQPHAQPSSSLEQHIWKNHYPNVHISGNAVVQLGDRYCSNTERSSGDDRLEYHPGSLNGTEIRVVWTFSCSSPNLSTFIDCLGYSLGRRHNARSEQYILGQVGDYHVAIARKSCTTNELGACADAALCEFPNISVFIHMSLEERESTACDGLEIGDIVVGMLNKREIRLRCRSLPLISARSKSRTERAFTLSALNRFLDSMKIHHGFYSSELQDMVQSLGDKLKVAKTELRYYTMLQSVNDNATNSSSTNTSCLVTQIPCLVITGTCIYERHQETDELLLRYTSTITASYARQLTLNLPGSSHQQERMVSLKFDEADLRLATIKSRWRNTCAWFLESSIYTAWLSATTDDCFTSSLLWIRGTPGSGKSTLMKFILANLRREQIDTSIVNFFFNARGVELEKCATGMYRSILYQLLLAFPMLQSVLEAPWVPPLVVYDSQAWNIESLQLVLKDLITKLESQSIIWLVDALDECNEDEVRDMIDFLESLIDEARQRAVSLRVLFSSRHYPQITANSIDVVLETEKGHIADITSYIHAQLRITGLSQRKMIATEVIQRSRGIFLWVVLVVALLNKKSDRGRCHDWKQVLAALPDRLETLFRDIIDPDTDNSDTMRACFRWLLFLPGRPTQAELYYALRLREEPETEVDDMSDVDPDIMSNYILDSSRGLAESTQTKPIYVQFIHETVREYLLQEMPKWTNQSNGKYQQQEPETDENQYTQFNSLRIKKLREFIPAIFDPNHKYRERCSRACRLIVLNVFEELETISSAEDPRVKRLDQEYDASPQLLNEEEHRIKRTSG